MITALTSAIYGRTSDREQPGSAVVYMEARQIAAAVVEFLTGDQFVEQLTEELNPGLFSLSDLDWSVRWDNGIELRTPMQQAAVSETRAALRAVLGGSDVDWQDYEGWSTDPSEVLRTEADRLEQNNA